MRKLFAIMLVLALLVPSLAITTTAEEPYKISILLPSFYTETFQYENNATLQAIEAATNTKLEVTFVPDAAFAEARSLALAGDMPTLFPADPKDPLIVQSARAGAFWDITDAIKDYEYLAAGSEVVYDSTKIDGRLFGIYRSRPLARNGIIYRSDWAESLGFSEVATLDDLYNLAIAMTDTAKGTYGINMCKYVDGTIKIITIMHGAPNTYGVNADGDIYPSFEDAKFRAGLDYLRSLYAAGAINQNFMTLESTIWDDPIKNDLAGIKLDVLDGGYRLQDWFVQNKGVAEDNDVFTLLPVVANAEGEEHMWPTTGYNGVLFVTKTAKTEADLAKVLSFLNYLNGPEGQTLANWGVQDVTYWVDDEGYRVATPTDVEVSVRSLQGSINQMGMGVPGALDVPSKAIGLRAVYNQILLDYPSYVVGNPCAAFLSETYSMVGKQLDTLLEDAHVQYIANMITAEQLEAVYQQWRAEGGEAVVSEMNAAYQAAK